MARAKRKRPNRSEALREQWKNPEYKAQQLAALNRDGLEIERILSGLTLLG